MRAFSYGYNLPPCQGTCYKEAPLVTDLSATPTGTQLVCWSPPSSMILPCSSSSSSSRMRNNALPGHDPHTVGRRPSLVISTISKLSRTDRLESQGQPKDQNLDVYAFLPHPRSPHHILCQFSNIPEPLSKAESPPKKP